MCKWNAAVSAGHKFFNKFRKIISFRSRVVIKAKREKNAQNKQ